MCTAYYPCYTTCMTPGGFYSKRPKRGGSCRLLKLRCEWGLKEDKRMGSFLGGFFGLVVPVQEVLVLPLAALVGPVQNIFFITAHYFNSFVPIAQQRQAGQAAVLCLWFYSISFDVRDGVLYTVCYREKHKRLDHSQ